MKVWRCDRDGCPSPVFLIEFESIDTPEQLLAVEAERELKSRSHDEKHHSGAGVQP